MFVGPHPRKNMEGLLTAFERYVDRGGLRLGHRGCGHVERVVDVTPLVRKRIHRLGRLPHDELPKVVGAAEALVFVPWFEGFGIPVLKPWPAACCHCQQRDVVTWYADTRLALVSPGDSDEIAQAMWT